eukprot:155600-Chlamydomonas_euryale.AAC.1
MLRAFALCLMVPSSKDVEATGNGPRLAGPATQQRRRRSAFSSCREAGGCRGTGPCKRMARAA